MKTLSGHAGSMPSELGKLWHMVRYCLLVPNYKLHIVPSLCLYAPVVKLQITITLMIKILEINGILSC